MKKYTCTVCGYIRFIADGSEAPDKCYTCHAPADKFKVDVEAEAEDTSKSEKPDADDSSGGSLLGVLGNTFQVLEEAQEQSEDEILKILHLAEEHYDRKEYSEAVRLYLGIAGGSDRYAAIAQSYLGFMYRHGQGVEQNHRMAAEWLVKASDNGDESAKKELAAMQAEELEIKELFDRQRHFSDEGDYATAVKIIEQIVAHKGLPAQLREAAMNLLSQTKKTWAAATFRDGVIARDAKDYKKSMQLYMEVLKQTDDPEMIGKAEYGIGVYYFNGEGISKDRNTAIQWIKKAAKKGDEDALKALKDLNIPEHLW